MGKTKEVQNIFVIVASQLIVIKMIFPSQFLEGRIKSQEWGGMREKVTSITISYCLFCLDWGLTNYERECY